MTIGLSSSEHSSQCRRWKEKKKTGKDRLEEVDGKRQDGTGRSRKGEASKGGAPMDMTVDEE